MRPRCCLRYLTRFGINISGSSPGRGAGGAGSAIRHGPGTAAGRGRPHAVVRLGAALRDPGHGLVEQLAVEHPHLDPARAVGRERRGAREIDVGAQRVERHPPLAVGLVARHFGAAQAARAGDADALRAGAHRGSDRLLHAAAERDALLELLGDVLGDQLGVEVGALDLLDVELHDLLGELLHLLRQLVDLLALAADDQAGTRGADADRDLVALALDRDLGDARLVEPLLEVALDEQVFAQQLGVVALREPARVPGLHDAEPQPDWMRFLAHQSDSLVATVTETWLMRFRIGVARPCARGSQRLSVGPAPTTASFTYSSSSRTLPSRRALATADL